MANSHLLGFALVLVACKGVSVDLPDAAPSPQAKAEPALLANVPVSAGGTGASNASPDSASSAAPLRSDESIAPDIPREPAHEPARDTRETAGYAVQAILRSGEGPGAQRAPEVNVLAIEGARRKTEARLAIEVSQVRARFVLAGGFVLPQGIELRARVDRYGHLVLWPGEEVYRVAEPGALRALFGERRLDVAPLSQANVVSTGQGAHRLDFRTRRVEVTTRAAKAMLELASLRDAGDGGTLVCRFLYDLMSAPPSTSACATDELPLHAELRWTTQGSLVFDVLSVARHADLSGQDLAVPPSTLSFASSAPPFSSGEALVPKAELAAFRTAPVDFPLAVSRDGQAPPPDAGLTLVNGSDELRVAWIDGVAAAWVGPGGRLSLPSLLRGRYLLQWRTFLGDGWEPPETIVVPGTIEVAGH